MDLYLMQHGAALTDEQDPARPLTEAGHSDVERVVARARRAGVDVDRCLHSGKLRAQQTASLLADALEIPEVEAHAGLNPGDDVAAFAGWLAQIPETGSVAVVGHLPFLGKLASLLVAGDEAAAVIRFRNAGLVKLVRKKDAPGYCVAWILVPELT